MRRIPPFIAVLLLALALRAGVVLVDERFDGVDNQLKELKQGQESIELRLANVAYRFELQALQKVVENIQEQVVVLNQKVEMKSS